MKQLLLIFCVLLLSSCGHEGPGVRVGRFDQSAARGEMPSDTAALAALFAASGYGELSGSSLAAYAAQPSIAYHLEAVDSAFADLSWLESKLWPSHRYYAIISPFNQSVITVDSLVFIGLNHYLGEDYSAYGYFPDFVRKRKVKARILPDVAEAIVRAENPFEPSGTFPTAIERMVYEGAVAQKVMEMTGLPEREVLGYDTDEYSWAKANEAQAWSELTRRRLLFSTDPDVARQLTALSPATTILTPDAPGAYGRYIGLQIVKAYLDSHPGVNFLTDRLYNSPSLLQDSGY